MNRSIRALLALPPLIASAAIAQASQHPADATAEIPPDARIGFAIGRFDPAIGRDTESRTLRAADAALRCTRPGGLGLPPLLSIACIPFGAVSGTGTPAGAEDVQEAEAKMAPVAKALDLPRVLSDTMFRYARLSGLAEIEDRRDEAPISSQAPAHYRPGTGYVIEIALIDLKAITLADEQDMRYRFVIRARGRLVNTSDGAVVDEFTKVRSTRLASVEQWTAEDGKVVSGEFRVALEVIARAFIDEWVLVYRGHSRDKAPRSSPLAATQRTPDYVLEPIDPAVTPWPIFGVKLFAAGTPAELRTLTPTLSWARLPQSVQADYFSDSYPRARNLTYEVRIYSAGLGRTRLGPYSAPVAVVRSYSKLVEPNVEVKEPLSPCTYYFWTVRAQFELDGRPRHTEWSFGTPDLDPRWERRSSVPSSARWPVTQVYYPFRTPAPVGQQCGDARFIKL